MPKKRVTHEKNFIRCFKNFCDGNGDCGIEVKNIGADSTSKRIDVEIAWNDTTIMCEEKAFKSDSDKSNEIWEIFGQILGGRRLNQNTAYKYAILVPQTALHYLKNELHNRFILNDLKNFKKMYGLDYVFIFDEELEKIQVKSFPHFNTIWCYKK